MRRAIALILCLCLLPLAGLAAGEPRVSLSYTCADASPDVGSEVTFTITSENCAVTSLMVVAPDSSQSYYEGEHITVQLKQRGVYAFIAYGANGTDASAKGFQRCMSERLLLGSPATTPAPTEEPVAEAELKTPQMLYVERFFDENGTLYASSQGKRLFKWLDMSVREDGGERVNSGYLMLEQEQLFQESTWKTFTYWIAKGGTDMLATVGSGAIGAISAWIGENKLKERFPHSGSKGYAYYTQLSDFYVSYSQQLLEEIVRTNAAMSTVDELAQNVDAYELAVNSAGAMLAGYDAWKQFDTVCNVEKRTIGLLPGNGTKNYMVVTVNGSFQGADGVMHFTGSFEGLPIGVDDFTIQNVLNRSRDQNVIFTVHDLVDDHDVDHALRNITSGIEDIASKSVNALPAGATVADLQGRLQKLDALVQRLPERTISVDEKEALKIAEDRLAYPLIDPTKSQWSKADSLSLGLSTASTALSWYSYLSSTKQVAASQYAYYQVICRVSDEYETMLGQWRDDVKASTMEDKEALVDAIQAVIDDIAATKLNTLENAANRAKVDAECFQFGSGIAVAIDSLMWTADLPGFKTLYADIAKPIKELLAKNTTINMTNLAKFTKSVSWNKIAASFISMAINFFVGDDFNFREQVEIVYRLKGSLVESVHEQLLQYGKVPSHEAACTVIASLKTLKSLKHQGESLVEMFYIGGFFQKLGLDDNTQTMETLLWYELGLRTYTEKLNVEKYVSPKLTGVLEARLVYSDAYKDEPWYDLRRHGGRFYQYAILYFLCGLYKQSYQSITYKGEELLVLPAAYQGLQSRLTKDAYFEVFKKNYTPSMDEYSNYDNIINFPKTFKAGWQSSYKQITTADKTRLIAVPYYLYKRDGAEILLLQSEYEAYLENQATMNEVLASTAETEKEIRHLFGKAQTKAELKQRLEWVRITRGFIDSLPMYGEE